MGWSCDVMLLDSGMRIELHECGLSVAFSATMPTSCDETARWGTRFVGTRVLVRWRFGGCGLDGADFDVGVLAGVVDAVAGDPYLAFAEHGSLIVDEEVFVLLLFDDGGDVGCDDVVVVLDEGCRLVDVGGFAVELDPDGIVDESGYGGGIVFGYGCWRSVRSRWTLGGSLAEQGVDGLYRLLGAGWLGGGDFARGRER